MNTADIFVIAIIAISCIVSYSRGFIVSLFKFVSLILSVYITYIIYPYISSFLRTTSMYTNLKQGIREGIHMKLETQSLSAQTDFINSLNFPGFIRDVLIENNNPEIYNILNVNGLEDYISGYIANICINIVSSIGLFIVVIIALNILVYILDIVSKLPVINSINKLFGLLFGLLTGLLVIWILFIGLTFFYSNPNMNSILVSIEESSIAKYLYHNNMLINIVLMVFVK